MSPRSIVDLCTAPPLPAEQMAEPCLLLDLSASNPRLKGFDVADPAAFGAWVESEVRAADGAWAAGGYAEDRIVYGLSPLFGGEGSARSVHLGVDFWMPSGTPVQAIADGRVHSFADNARFGDYGPTILVEHRVQGQTFYALYGHLDRVSLQGLERGQAVQAGQQLARLGAPEVNMGWAPHLHLQMIRDIGGAQGDFPGVCAKAQAGDWLNNCPDPTPILRRWCPQLLSSAGPLPSTP